MARSTSFSVGAHFNAFIAAQVKDGRYSTASDVVRAGLRLLEEHETRLDALRTALIEGEDSGTSDRDVRDIWARVKERGDITRG